MTRVAQCYVVSQLMIHSEPPCHTYPNNPSDPNNLGQLYNLPNNPSDPNNLSKLYNLRGCCCLVNVLAEPPRNPRQRPNNPNNSNNPYNPNNSNNPNNP
jgi:hypothetical protein